jgi:hypothetical protein
MPEQQISWMALEEGTAVHSKDGEDLGKVTTIVADRTKDIFSGIAFKDGLLGTEQFAPASDIEEITEDRVRLSLSTEAARNLDAYES